MTEYENLHPCRRSGQCCKKGPCAFGEVTSPTNPSCRFLEIQETITDGLESAEIHRCGKYHEIIKEPDSYWNPAFGAGCCQPLFNESRAKIIRITINKGKQ